MNKQLFSLVDDFDEATKLIPSLNEKTFKLKMKANPTDLAKLISQHTELEVLINGQSIYKMPQKHK